MPRITTLLLLSALLALSGCSSLRFPGVYRIDIPQGNFVTEDMLSQLQPGMTPDQVRFALGAPTLIDPFTPNVWFYPMTYRPGKGDKVTQKIAVYFDGGSYSRYEGQVIDDFKAKTSGRDDRELEQKAERHKEDSE
ncbi:outer membrane protein assembly factor BamE [Alcanivorax sp. S6407]|uniref:outer membrane protein assembly factor BamE n=1 Tax=Alcanivorax sp. S6407 TaxID=2926424 RepID=UPI001FF2A7BF|nr:outer membrane protein assembly factor BamE [Alcanivorax sp. S6407]MCK0154026.1 outer membrane protein assembly factor BamE [Alcanivorax sp. S6407]